MASCCWHKDWLAAVHDPQSWAVATDGWVDFARSGDVTPYSAFFSGSPTFLAGSVGLKAWRIYGAAMAQFASSYQRFHHQGRGEGMRYGRANVLRRFGGSHPVVVLVVPDGHRGKPASRAWMNSL